MTKGRPKLPDDQRMVSVSLRLPQDLVEWYDACVAGVTTRSDQMRKVLEDYAKQG